jgi:hypothetical protein
MAQRGRPDIAFGILMEALRINPDNPSARKLLAQISPLLGEGNPGPQFNKIQAEMYPSSAPRKLVQMGSDAKGRNIPDGIEVQFYENGRIQRLVDIKKGLSDGLEITWDKEGRILSCVVYLEGKPADNETLKSL